MKVRSDFVTNSSSSSFVVLSIDSQTFADIIRRFQEELEVQGWFQINELEGSKVSLLGDETCAETPTNFADVVSSLARMFYEEVYIPDEYCCEEDAEEARLTFEEELKESADDWDCNLEMRIAKAIVDAKEDIESDIQSISMTCGDVGWGGDDDSRYEKESYTEEQLKELYEIIAKENGCSVNEVSDYDFSYYVGGKISNREDVYTYDRQTGKEEHSSSYRLD